MLKSAACAGIDGFSDTRRFALMDQQRVLITGGAGFLGINLIEAPPLRGYAVASLDVEEFDYPERGPGRGRQRRHPEQSPGGPGDRGRRLRRPHRRRPAALLARGHLHHRCRRHAQRPRCALCGTGSSASSTSPPPPSTASPTTTRCTRRTGWTASARMARPRSRPRWSASSTGPGGCRPDHPPQVVRRPGAPRRLRAALRLGATTGTTSR